MDNISPKENNKERQVKIPLWNPTPIRRERESIRTIFPHLMGLKTFHARTLQKHLQRTQNYCSIEALNLKESLLYIPSLAQQWCLENFRVHFQSLGSVNPDLDDMITLNLTQLSLRNVVNLEVVMFRLQAFSCLEYLALGPIDKHYSQLALGGGLLSLKYLKCLRLECKQNSTCSASIILNIVCSMNALIQLELVNFHVEGDFCLRLGHCKNLRHLLIAPINRKRVLNAIKTIYCGLRQVANNLKHITWIFYNSIEAMMQQGDHEKLVSPKTVKNKVQNVEVHDDSNTDDDVRMDDDSDKIVIANGSHYDIKDEHCSNVGALDKWLKLTVPNMNVRLIVLPPNELCDFLLETKWD